MATIEEIQQIFRRSSKIRVKTEEVEGIIITIDGVDFSLPESEVDQYLAIRDQIEIHNGTSVYFPGFFENVVEILNLRHGLRQMIPAGESNVSIASPDGLITAQIDQITLRFILAIMDQTEDAWRHLEEAMLPAQYVASRSPVSSGYIPFSELLKRVISVQVSADPDFRKYDSRDTLHAIGEGAIFNIAYARGVGLNMSRSWERQETHLGLERQYAVQFPLRKYDSELAAYYQLAVASDSSITAYIMLYNILESFFVSTAENMLLTKMRERMVEPNFNFRHVTSLRKLVNTVRSYDVADDDEKVLAKVIEEHFDPQEIMDWMNESLPDGGAYYLEKHKVFGRDQQIDMRSDQLYSSIAKRLSHVNSTLVYNKQGESLRIAPFTEREETIIQELPLIMYLAEQMIIKTAGDLI